MPSQPNFKPIFLTTKNWDAKQLYTQLQQTAEEAKPQTSQFHFQICEHNQSIRNEKKRK